jgi:hypothetical protein
VCKSVHPLYEVSVRAGHLWAAFTADRYRHLFDDADEAYVSKLDRLLIARHHRVTHRSGGIDNGR